MKHTRESEHKKAQFYRWLKEVGYTPSLAKPCGQLPQSAINHMKMVPYQEVIKNVRSDDKE